MSALGLVLVLALLAGCGGGGGENGNGGGGKTTTGGEKKDKPKPPTGSVIRDFQAQLAGNRVRLSYTLTKPVTKLSLRVERGSGEAAERVGKVDFGNRPKGAGTLMWNLALDGKRVPAGRYSLQLRGPDVGKSRPVAITVPGA